VTAAMQANTNMLGGQREKEEKLMVL